MLSDDGILLPAQTIIHPAGAFALLEIPTRDTALEAGNSQLARNWRLHIGVVFENLFARGFIVTESLTES